MDYNQITMNNQDIFNLIENKHDDLEKTIDVKFGMIDKNLSKILKTQDKTDDRVTLLEAFHMTFRYKMIGAVAIAVVLAVVIHQFGFLELLGIIK